MVSLTAPLKKKKRGVRLTTIKGVTYQERYPKSVSLRVSLQECPRKNVSLRVSYHKGRKMVSGYIMVNGWSTW